MVTKFQDRISGKHVWIWTIVAAILLGAGIFGYCASIRWLALLVAGIGGVILLQRPVLGLPVLIIAALIGRVEFGTGTAVAINLATLTVPALLILWIMDMVRRREMHLVPSWLNAPLLAFLFAGLLSLLIGTALWDPAVPRPDNFTIVQMAQWAIFAFSAGALWLTANLVDDETWLRRLTFLFLVLAGGLAIMRVLPVAIRMNSIATLAVDRAPFWMLLTALAGGQLIFNQELGGRWRLFLLATLTAVLIYAFYLERATASNWICVATVACVLAWLRFPRLRWPVVVLVLALSVTGFLTSTLYEFAGGQAEWAESGGSRLALISRVVEVTLRNPITGLGPAAYRPYAAMKPLPYGEALWIVPLVNSHNNYVDLFSHVGLLGLGIFAWFAVQVTRLGFHLRTRFAHGFASGYVNAMLAALAGALVLMLFADWILPFVYNISFAGFQASVLTWLFLGGLVVLERLAEQDSAHS